MTWCHDLAHHGVTKLDHRLDEALLFDLDHRVFGGGFNKPKEFLLVEKRPLLKPLALHEEVRESDQQI